MFNFLVLSVLSMFEFHPSCSGDATACMPALLGKRVREMAGSECRGKKSHKNFFRYSSVWLSSAELAITAVSSFPTFIPVEKARTEELEIFYKPFSKISTSSRFRRPTGQ